MDIRRGQLPDASGHGRHGMLRGNPAGTEARARGYRLVYGPGDRAVRSREVFPAGEWTHPASAFDRSRAVRPDGSGRPESDDDSLHLAEDLTREVFGTLDRLGDTHRLTTRGRLGSGDGTVPYRLSVPPDGRVGFARREAGAVLRGTAYSGASFRLPGR
ncbi:hypothetical protein AB0I99_02240 [Streptomyces spongiicola]|uniref:hypothetical protein n=1 Tax=Streptomyces spongiicola TaxID=1690221 RepID=UPI0033D58B65